MVALFRSKLSISMTNSPGNMITQPFKLIVAQLLRIRNDPWVPDYLPIAYLCTRDSQVPTY